MSKLEQAEEKVEQLQESANRLRLKQLSEKLSGMKIEQRGDDQVIC